ncbi:MAG: radical SAM protein [Clostridia bacterium]
MIEKFVETNSYLTKTKLPVSDFVINPYVGCPHGCKYCYARFMKRFTFHDEPWGDFVDVKLCKKGLNVDKLIGKSITMSSVTDCYNPAEEKYQITKGILEQLQGVDVEITIVTKSALVLRDIDILKKLNNVQVAFSINTLDENFKNDMDKASPIADRINALKVLKENGISTVVFMSPMFPVITDFKAIIEATQQFVDVFWFENLNLRAGYKADIMAYVKEKYKELYPLYEQIFNKKDRGFWIGLAKEIDEYCVKNKLKFVNYFYHEEIRKK